MEKGLYSVKHLQELIIRKSNHFLYLAENNSYGDFIEVEFIVESDSIEGLIVKLYRYYMNGNIRNLDNRICLIEPKHYQHISLKSRFL